MSLALMKGRFKLKNAFLIFLLSVCILFVFFKRNFHGLFESDAFLYAEVARNIYEGKGITSDIIYPFEVSSIKSLNHPYFMQNCLQVILIALSFRLFGLREWAVALPGIICFLLIALFIYLLGRRLFGERVGVLGSLLFMTDTNMLLFSNNGMVEITCAFFLLAAVYFHCRQPARLNFFLSGFCLGLCQLARQGTFLFVWGFILYIFLRHKQKFLTYSAIFILGFVSMSSFEYLRIFIYTGSLLTPHWVGNFFCNTSLVPKVDGALAPIRMLHPPRMPYWEYIRTYPLDFLNKYATLFIAIIKDMPVLISPYRMVFFFPGLLKFEEDSAKTGFRLLVYSMFFTLLFVLPAFSYVNRYFLPLVPFVMLIIADFIVYAIDKLLLVKKSVKVILGGILSVILLSPVIWQLLFGVGYFKDSFRARDKRTELRNFILKNTEANSLIVSDLFEVVAWETRRYAMWIPIPFSAIYEIDTKFKISYILLTSTAPWFYNPSARNELTDILLYNKPIKGFKLKAEYNKNNHKALLYAREESKKN